MSQSTQGSPAVDALFGPAVASTSGSAPRRTRIIATIGPASASVEVMTGLIRAGMDMARINFSHARAAADAEALTSKLREAMRAAGRPIRILGDLQGPKIRLGALAAPLELTTGASIALCAEGAAKDRAAGLTALPIEPPTLLADLLPGHRVLINDGKVELTVFERTAAAAGPCLIARVERGGPVSSRKGLNLPDTQLSERIPTPKDAEDIATALRLGMDAIAASFVEDGEDIARVRAAAPGASLRIIAKIERPRALTNLEAIAKAADGLMVARGDLAVEVGAALVPMWQRRIHALGNRLGVVTGTATEMLESMIESSTPTRAEASDVATSVFEGAEFVMTSAETAMGKHPVKVIEAMRQILEATEQGLAQDA